MENIRGNSIKIISLEKNIEAGGNPAVAKEKSENITARGLFWYFILESSDIFLIVILEFQSFIETKSIV